jgi:hypothetical protein
VLYPTLNYHFYPSFVEYAGSTTLRLETARDMVIDIVRTIAAHGPRRFYLLNTASRRSAPWDRRATRSPRAAWSCGTPTS